MANNPYRALKERYLGLYKEHGYSPKSLGWTKGKQDMRFSQLTRDWDLRGKRFLDVGCGFGDFVGYLQRHEYDDYSYLGIDLLEEFIGEGEKQYGSDRVNFLCGSVEEIDLEDNFDFGIASGTFNEACDVDDCYDMVAAILQKMFNVCQTAISVDFLTDRVDYRYSHNFNYSPEKILGIAYSLSRRVVLRNDLFPFEFSVTIFRDDTFDRNTTTFNAIKY